MKGTVRIMILLFFVFKILFIYFILLCFSSRCGYATRQLSDIRFSLSQDWFENDTKDDIASYGHVRDCILHGGDDVWLFGDVF